MDNEIIECLDHKIHPLLQKIAKSKIPSPDTAEQLAQVFKLFGDATRINIMCTLLCGEMCVCDIAELLQMTPSAVSHQLSILRQNRLVKARRSGKSAFYSLDDSHINLIINAGLEHINE